MQRVDDQSRLGDGGANVVEGVDELLHLAAVLRNAEVALVQVVELLLGEHGAMETVVEVEVGDGGPDVVGVGLRLVDVIHDGLGHRGVVPRHDARINLEPLRIMAHEDRVEGAVDVAHEGELLEGEVEERTPLTEIGRVHVEGDRNVAMDVEEGNGRGRRWSTRGEGREQIAAVGRGVRGGVGACHEEHARRAVEEKKGS